MMDRMEAMGYTVIREPVEVWRHWLDRWEHDLFFFEVVVIAWYLAVWPKAGARGRFVVERSPFTARHVFGGNREWETSDLADVYAGLYEKAMERCRVDMYVFVHECPSMCLRKLRATTKKTKRWHRTVSLPTLKAIDAGMWRAVVALRRRGERVFVV